MNPYTKYKYKSIRELEDEIKKREEELFALKRLYREWEKEIHNRYFGWLDDYMKQKDK